MVKVTLWQGVYHQIKRMFGVYGAGVKSVAMIHVADINKVTGYIRGGCSPVGMKKQFATVYDESCLDKPTIMVSGGRIGTQIECAPADLIRLTRGKTAPITAEG